MNSDNDLDNVDDKRLIWRHYPTNRFRDASSLGYETFSKHTNHTVSRIWQVRVNIPLSSQSHCIFCPVCASCPYVLSVLQSGIVSMVIC